MLKRWFPLNLHIMSRMSLYWTQVEGMCSQSGARVELCKGWLSFVENPCSEPMFGMSKLHGSCRLRDQNGQACMWLDSYARCLPRSCPRPWFPPRLGGGGGGLQRHLVQTPHCSRATTTIRILRIDIELGPGVTSGCSVSASDTVPLCRSRGPETWRSPLRKPDCHLMNFTWRVCEHHWGIYVNRICLRFSPLKFPAIWIWNLRVLWVGRSFFLEHSRVPVGATGSLKE